MNKFPTTGTLLKPGVAEPVLSALSILIPPITTISPSVINNFVSISLVLIAGSSVPRVVSGESLLTKMSKSTFPSPIMLGVTVRDNATSLNSTVASPSTITV